MSAQVQRCAAIGEQADTDARSDSRTNTLTNSQTNGQTNSQTNSPTNSQTNGRTATVTPESAGWYVVYTKPRQERIACEHLSRQRFDVWLPTVGKWIRKGAERVCVSEPMFPRYLFLRTTRAAQSLAPVRSTIGAVGLVRFGLRPSTVDDETIATLHDLAGQTRAEPGPPRPGTRVRVMAGPLAGLDALVAASAAQRVELFMTLLGRETRVCVRPELVDAVAG